MASKEIRIGIIAPSAETRELLRIQLGTTGLASVEVEAEQYCAAYTDRAVRRFVEARPNVVIVDLHDPQAAIQSLHILHAALPETWLFVCSQVSDPQLIIETMRAGAREFFPNPIPARNLSQALGRFIAEKRRLQRSDGKIYCITAAKGGVGATSVSINLAASIARVPNAQVALVDLGIPVGDTAAHLNLKPQFTVNDALESATRLDPVLLESYMSRVHGVSVLPGLREFRPGELPGADALARLLEVVTQSYTHCFVDLSASMNKDHIEVITGMAATVIVVSTIELPSIWQTERLLRFLGRCGVNDKLRLVINRRRKSDEITDSEVERVLKHRVYWSLPNNYLGSIKAINSGAPVASANHSELASSYQALAHRLTDIPPPEKRRGLFKLFS